MTALPAKRAAHRGPGWLVVVVGLLGLGVAALVVAFVVFAWPSTTPLADGSIKVEASLVPAPGDDPLQVADGKFWLVNLEPGEGVHGGFGEAGPGGLLALWWRDPHLGCTVPWRATMNFEGSQGWFRNPCHGETYTKAGVRVFGPAPRSLDTMALHVNGDGSVSVFPERITRGGFDNPRRAVAYEGGGG